MAETTTTRTRPAGPLDDCPACGGHELTAVVDREDVNFLCADCGRCWHVELARVHRVDPFTCGGCPHREECLARY
jgi:hypothetical protein